ncbi:unnamed protein product [Moneuplotes crassus]|uniref:Uncharacterized protein n=1 Tax=Euplotes crassus TaxID=5936 RepID=A0AAD1Y8P4_EUPCR|nr:unnamed protein product [Moneuplotes crassus]
MASRLDSSMPKDFDILYSVLTGKKSKVGPNYSLNLDLSCEKDMKFIQKLKGPIPDVKNLQMESLPQDCEEVVNRFMADNFPSRVGNFDFNLNSKLVRIDPYLDEILAVKARIQVKLSLYKLKLSKQQLCKVLEECKHLKTIGFNYCNLKIPSVPYFEDDLSESKIQYLGFDYSGDGDYSDWDQNPDEFCNLIKGLSYCEDFTANLSGIYLKNCGLSKIKIDEVFSRNGLTKVQILNYSK